jgi:para-nitrobenzyl esterase
MHSGAVAQNMPATSPFAPGPMLTRAQAEAQGKELAAADSIKCDTAADVAKCLRGKKAMEINNAISSFTYDAKLGADAYWTAILEPGGVLEDTPYALAKAGKLVNKVPVLLGANRLEGGRIFVSGFENLTAKEVTDRWKVLFGDTTAAAIEKIYPPSSTPPIGKCLSPCAAVVNMATDAWYVCAARRTARVLTSAAVDTYLFHFTYPVWKTLNLKEHLGSSHGTIKVYVFYTPQIKPPPPYVCGISGKEPCWPAWVFAPDEDKMAKEIMAYWARFARTGDPNGGSAVKWPKYDTSTDEHLELGATIKPGSKLRESYCDFWDSLAP